MQIDDNNKEYSQDLMSFSEMNLIDDGDENNFGFIPSLVQYVVQLNDIFEEGMTFIDLGCGPGNVLSYANRIGYDVLGVEWNEDLIKNTKGKYNIIKEDITKLDPKVWSDKDVVYCYVPLRYGYREFVDKIASNMKSGSYLFTPEFFPGDIDGFVRINKYIIKKI